MYPRELAGLPLEVRHLVHAVNRYRDDYAESSPQRRNELWTGMHRACDAVWDRRLTWRDHLAYQAGRITSRVRQVLNRTDTR